MTKMEIWKDIKGYEGLYQVSNFGNIRSFMMYDGKKYRERNEPYILRKTMTTTGYWKVELFKNKIRKSKRIHRLIAEAFIPNPYNKKEVNHKDLNKLNNDIENLEWVTHQENMKHAGENFALNNLNEELSKSIIEKYKSGLHCSQIASELNVITETTVRNHLRKKGVKMRSVSEIRDKYKINRKDLVSMFESETSTKDIVEKLGGNNILINTYRYLWRKGDLKI